MSVLNLHYSEKPVVGAPAAPEVAIRLLKPADCALWDEFVYSHPCGSPFHLIAWKECIEETFGYKPMYLLATDDERVVGVLPLFLVENLLMKKVLLSTPFAVYGGALVENEQARRVLRAKLEDLATGLKVQYVELRNGHPEQGFGFQPLTRYVTFTQSIGPDEAALLESIPRKTRRMVRKALEPAPTVRVQEEWSQAFVDLYLENLRRLGTPAFPDKHFRNILKKFRGMVNVREVVHDGKVSAAVLTFLFRDQVMPYYGASDPAANAFAPSNFMYFDLMRWGGRNGYALFDFGRSKKESGGSYDFKSHWGMLERELPYEILLGQRKELPNFSPNNPRFQFFIRMWRKIPLPITRLLGPWLIRLVP